MVPDDFWVGLAGGVITAFFDGFVAFVLVPLSALTAEVLAWLQVLLPLV